MNTKSGPYDSYWIRIRGNESSACLPVHAPKEEPDSRLLNQKSKRSAKQFNHKFIDQCYVNFLICYTTRSFMGNGIYTVKGFMGLLAPNEYKTGLVVVTLPSRVTSLYVYISTYSQQWFFFTFKIYFKVFAGRTFLMNDLRLLFFVNVVLMVDWDICRI